MPRLTRRRALAVLGSTAASVAGFGGEVAAAPGKGTRKPKGTLRKLGHSLLSDPPGGYAEGVIRDDGRYGLLGSYLGEGGSFLVDLANPTDPTELHRVPSSGDVINADVAFDHRDGLYYRTQEPATDDAQIDGVEVIDYGYSDGTPEDPTILGTLPAGPTHNLFPHPEESILYTTEENGMGVWDVSEPTEPSLFDVVGPDADLHDVVVDPQRALAHLAFIGGGLDGYVIMDTSEPTAPTEVGRFDYAGRPDYTEIGTAGFESCHYADYDPERAIVVVGDEIGLGVPGGKHVFDIGWDEGSPEDPRHVGFFHSPNAEVMDESIEFLDWTTHNHDIISKGSTTMMVDGGYREGAWLADISDPRNPVSTDRYATLDGIDEANGMLIPENPPVAWSADYSAERDLTLVADQTTGVYTFKVTPSAAENIATH
ncbi:MAG: LVIVD repeat-containing protein [Halanaeroarchaeum sp.]